MCTRTWHLGTAGVPRGFLSCTAVAHVWVLNNVRSIAHTLFGVLFLSNFCSIAIGELEFVNGYKG